MSTANQCNVIPMGQCQVDVSVVLIYWPTGLMACLHQPMFCTVDSLGQTIPRLYEEG